MVQRYYAKTITTEVEGMVVLHSDYLKLKAALREALVEWERRVLLKNYSVSRDRIAELRKEFEL